MTNETNVSIQQELNFLQEVLFQSTDNNETFSIDVKKVSEPLDMQVLKKNEQQVYSCLIFSQKLVYLRDESEMYRLLLNRVIPVYLAEDSVYSVVRPLPFKNAISIDGKLPVEPQYIFWSATLTYKNRIPNQS